MTREIITTWVLGGLVFAVGRVLFGVSEVEAYVIGFIFYILSFYWFIVPFINGKDMSLPSFSNTVLIKGKDDYARYFMFSVGVFMYFVALTA